ncbi:Nudix (Nucleoside diphosphate linked moiety X)-type motif 16 [Fasciola hepatica]|uniref:U8 snoRNA-decapping enzyme n=1 Tax=Fasciola hepatica TaxID=6192 RepID=A0A4E0RTM3_FASHE|nr:Nudix (Nucleoside diphosphate linked moiety X)-type motif 16 [Fasciola hepatica]
MKQLGSRFPIYQSVEGSFESVPDCATKIAAHGMYYTLTDGLFLNQYECRAQVMMQMRFDGCLGFPGGLVDPEDNSIEDGLNREITEEMGASSPALFFSRNDFAFKHLSKSTNYLLYFYVKRVPPEEYGFLERCVLNAREYGKETLGIIRVPCYTMDDGFKGLPTFFNNRFAGNAKLQLILGLLKAEILSLDELTKALDASKSN